MKTNNTQEDAIKNLIPIIKTLDQLSWHRIVAIIDHAYSSKAAKVQLDSSDLEKLKRHLYIEIIGDPHFSQSRSE